MWWKNRNTRYPRTSNNKRTLNPRWGTMSPWYQSNLVAIPDFSFYWSFLPVASVVTRVRDIVYVVILSSTSFSNHRPCLKRNRVSLRCHEFQCLTEFRFDMWFCSRFGTKRSLTLSYARNLAEYWRRTRTSWKRWLLFLRRPAIIKTLWQRLRPLETIMPRLLSSNSYCILDVQRAYGSSFFSVVLRKRLILTFIFFLFSLISFCALISFCLLDCNARFRHPGLEDWPELGSEEN